MLNNLIFILETEERSAFGNLMRSFFGLLAKFTYKFFSGAIDLIYDLAIFPFIDNEYISSISERVFNILVIFMLFKISLSILNYLVNPDLATDKDKGFQGIIKRVIISIVLLISINPIFSLLKDAQDAIINDDIITSIFADSSNSKYLKTDDINLVGVKMNENCPENKYIYTVSSGDRLALLLLRPFLQPYDESDIKSTSNGEKGWNAVFSESNDEFDMAHYCGYDISNKESFSLVMDSSSKSTQDNIKKAIPGPNSAEGLLRDYYYNLGINESDTDYFANGDGTTSYYFFDFNYIFAVLGGFIALLIAITFCFDVVIRSLTLVMLQILAPIPIISYVSPQGKSSEMLANWGKKLLSVWASLFIRIICLTLAITLITEACDNISENLKSGNASLIMQIFIILGILMFAKKLPKLLEELIPGLKLGGFQLNPFKRVKDEALGGKYVTGAAGALGRMGLDAVGQGASNLYAFGRNRHNLKKEIKSERLKGANADQEKINKLNNRLKYMNIGRAVSTTAGGVLGGARRGVVSGYKIGESGSANIFKDLKSDIKNGNTSRNNRQNIKDFNRELKRQRDTGKITSSEYKEQKYGIIERNVVERLDRNTGVKNEYGGYGLYDKKIEDLNKKIENLNQTESSLRTALSNYCANNNINQLAMEQLHEQLKSGNSMASALASVATSTGISQAKLTTDYGMVSNQLNSISKVDDDQKTLKAERKNYQEMMEARENAKNNK